MDFFEASAAKRAKYTDEVNEHYSGGSDEEEQYSDDVGREYEQDYDQDHSSSGVRRSTRSRRPKSRRSLDSDSEEGDGNDDTGEGDGDDSTGSKSPNSSGGLSKGKKKRIRRTASEIERAWKCTLCVKSYGSEGALKTHLKIKHPGAKLIKQAPPTTQQAFNRFYNMSQTSVPLTTPTFTTSGGVSPHLSPTNRPSSGKTDSSEEPTFGHVAQASKEEDAKNITYLPALLLKIGAFSKTSSFVGDVVSVFCYRERRFFWEILSAGALTRVEVRFDDVEGVGIEAQSDGTAVMVLQLIRPPRFWMGMMRPHSQTQWVPSSDFTQSQASRCRHHVIQFVKTALNDPLQRLLETESRFKDMAAVGLEPDAEIYFTPEEPPMAGHQATIDLTSSDGGGSPSGMTSPPYMFTSTGSAQWAVNFARRNSSNS